MESARDDSNKKANLLCGFSSDAGEVEVEGDEGKPIDADNTCL